MKPAVCLVICQHSDYAIHRSAVIAVRVLDAAFRTGGLGLIIGIQYRVEPAIERKHTRMIEGQREGPAIGWDNHVYATMARSVEGVVTDDGVIVGIVIDPHYLLTHADGDCKWG